MTNLAKTLLAGSIGVAALSGVNHAQTKLRPVKNIVLVHGAFADGTSWERVIPILEARGFHVVAVQNPLTTLADDANATRRLIALIDGPVILVGQLARNRSWNCGGRRRKPVGYRERVDSVLRSWRNLRCDDCRRPLVDPCHLREMLPAVLVVCEGSDRDPLE